MKWTALVVIVLLGVALILLPAPKDPESGAAPGLTEQPVAICATDEGSERSTNLAITSTVAGAGQVTIFSGNTEAGIGVYQTGDSGSVSVPMDGISAVGRAGALVEFPTADSAVATVITGATSLSEEVCSRIPERQVIIGGATTAQGQSFEIQLMNPYASEAVADIAGFSESGRESSDAFNSVVIPPRSSVILDIANILPGRESLAIVIEATRGSVVASAFAEGGGDVASWRPVGPDISWSLPLPHFAGQRELVIAAPTTDDVTYEVDIFGPFGFEEAALEGTISNGVQEVIDLAGISDIATAVRIVADAPIGVFARFTSEGGLGMTGAAPAATSNWLLPGAGNVLGGVGMLALVNVGLEATEVTVIEVRDVSRSRVVTLEPNEVIELELDELGSDGVSVTSDGEIVPMYMTQFGTAVAISGGFPLFDE